MGVTKTEIFTEEQNKIAQFGKVLGHPARIAIIQYIMKVEGCVCGELVHEIGLAQATISQHLKELKNAKIIKGTIEGNSICYCIDRKKWNEFKKTYEKFFGNFIKNESNCC